MLPIRIKSTGCDENGDKDRDVYLSSRHALRGPTLQQHLLLEPHLPPQGFLLKVLPQIYRGRHTWSLQLLKVAPPLPDSRLTCCLSQWHWLPHSYTENSRYAKSQNAFVTVSHFSQHSLINMQCVNHPVPHISTGDWNRALQQIYLHISLSWHIQEKNKCATFLSPVSLLSPFFLCPSHTNTHTHTVLVLTCNANVGTVALSGAGRAPGHTLAPEVFQPEQLLYLGPGHWDVHLPNHQPCAERAVGGDQWGIFFIVHINNALAACQKQLTCT